MPLHPRKPLLEGHNAPRPPLEYLGRYKYDMLTRLGHEVGGSRAYRARADPSATPRPPRETARRAHPSRHVEQGKELERSQGTFNFGLDIAGRHRSHEGIHSNPSKCVTSPNFLRLEAMAVYGERTCRSERPEGVDGDRGRIGEGRRWLEMVLVS